MSFSTYLISPTELHNTLRVANPPSTLKILCASWFLPTSAHTGISVFRTSHIPTARFFDLDAVKDPSSPYPHMMPSPSDFSTAMSSLGVRKTDTVVIYDSRELGLFSAPRVSWMLKAFGHEKVHVLDNYKIWCQQGLPTESGDVPPLKPEERVEYGKAKDPGAVVVGFEEMEAGARRRFSEEDTNEKTIVLDARPRGRWTGEAPEPRKGLSSGHMPGSVSLPASEVLDPETGGMLPKEKLREVFGKVGVTEESRVICSCGTGVTAAILETALSVAGLGTGEGKTKRRIYDGSWTEWAMRVDEEGGLIEKGEK